MRPTNKLDVSQFVNQIFGRWTVVAEAPSKNWKTCALCRCVCGTERVVVFKSIRIGISQGCRDCLKTHGLSRTPEWNIWMGMKARCFNQKSREYQHYGERGITVCERWLGVNGFKNFLADMGPRPSGRTEKNRALYSIDRIDVNRNYEPGNCRWATDKEQERNRRICRSFTIDGETKNLGEWAEIYGISYYRAYSRIKLGWALKEALSAPRTKSGPKRKAASV